MDPNWIVAGLGTLTLLAVFLKYYSKKTGWPLALFLMVLGLFIGPVLGFIDFFSFQQMIHSFAIIALVVVLFDTGYGLKINKIKKYLFRSLGLTAITTSSTLFVVFLLARYILNLNIYLSVLFAALIASTDLTIIAPLFDTLKVKQQVKEILDIEATLNSIISAVIAIVIASMITYRTQLSEAIGRGLIYHVSTGVSIGLIFGWGLLKLVRRLNLDDMPAIITIGSVLLVYSVSEIIGASGIVAALIVGLFFGNVKPAPPRFVMLFGENLQLILVALVYVFLGAMIRFDAFVNSAPVVLVLISSVILIRYFVVKFATLKQSLLNQRLVGVSGPRGIISAILILSYAHLFPNADLIISLGFAVILCTSLLVFVIPLIYKKTDNKIKEAGFRF